MASLATKLTTKLIQWRARASGAWIDGHPDLSWKDCLYNRIACISKVASIIEPQRYLEIGCDSGNVLKANACAHKVGVDPGNGGTIKTTSDAFFAGSTDEFDLVFIDGLHEYKQVKRDIYNSLKVLSDNGAILLHDCLPLNYPAQTIPSIAGHRDWNGDVWKAIAEVKQDPDVDLRVVTVDHGVGLLLPRPNSDRKDFGVTRFGDLDYHFYLEHYRDFGLIDFHGISDFIAGPSGGTVAG